MQCKTQGCHLFYKWRALCVGHFWNIKNRMNCYPKGERGKIMPGISARNIEKCDGFKKVSKAAIGL